MRAPAAGAKASARMQAQQRQNNKRLKKKRAREEVADVARRLAQEKAAAALTQRSGAAARGRARATESPAKHEAGAGGGRRAERARREAAPAVEPFVAAEDDDEEVVLTSPRMLAKARRRFFNAAENAFTLSAAHDALVSFVLSDERELALPPVNDAQRCGVRALATIFRLYVGSRGPKRQREYTVQKTRSMQGCLPEGKAEISVARLLAAKTDCKREMQDVCDRVLQQAGLVSRRSEKRRNVREAALEIKGQKRAAREARSQESKPEAQPPPPPAPPPAPLPPPLRWFIDRSGGNPGRAAAEPA